MRSVSAASITWLGHASAVIEIGGERVLIDPLGRRRAARAGQIDAILITHSHVDHLNRWTLSSLDRDVTVIVPHGAEPIIADIGFARVRSVEPGDHVALGSLDVIAVGTKHDRGRWRKGDRPMCVGYVVRKDGVVVHHAGDIDFSDWDIFEEIGRTHAIDTTLLPIGGMLPVWYYRMRRKSLDKGIHIDPDAALHIAEHLGARSMIPVHWGTVNLRLGPPSAPKKRLLSVAAERGVEGLVRVLGHGDSVSLTSPGGT